MNFIDDMKNKAMGSVAEQNPTISAALEMLKNHPGGLSGLVQQFHDKGLGDVVTSWVGTGRICRFPRSRFKACSATIT